MRPLIISFVLLAAVVRPSLADIDDSELEEGEIEIPVECLKLGATPLDDAGNIAPGGWDAMMSFAACIQDARLFRVAPTDDLAELVQRMHMAMLPSLQIYAVVLQHAPEDVKLRAAYAVARGQVSLITRARTSVPEPSRRAELEELLEPHATLAYLLFEAIDRTATHNPALASNVVSRHIAKTSRQEMVGLRTRWPAGRVPTEPPERTSWL